MTSKGGSSGSTPNTPTVDAVINAGNFGIGTETPDSIKLDVEDDIEVGTGTTGCVRDADNTTLIGTCVSDERLKENIESFPGILSDLTQLRPVTFEWRNDEFDWLNGQIGTNYGLIAQEVESIFPEMVHTDENGYKRVAYDVAFSTRLLQGIKELNLKVEDLASATSTEGVGEVVADDSEPFASRFFGSLYERLVAWFSDATNGIGEVVAKTFNASEHICVDGECLTKSDIRALKQLATSGAVNVVISGSDESASVALVPTIEIIGTNPAEIALGASYSDLGAVAKNYEGEEITYTVAVDGEDVSVVQINTDAAGTYIVTYSVTDNGETVSVDRTVIVGDATNEEEEIIIDSDNASGGEAEETPTEEEAKDDGTDSKATDDDATATTTEQTATSTGETATTTVDTQEFDNTTANEEENVALEDQSTTTAATSSRGQ